MKLSLNTQAQTLALRTFLNASKSGTATICKYTDDVFTIFIDEDSADEKELCLVTKQANVRDDFTIKVNSKLLEMLNVFEAGTKILVSDILAAMPTERSYYINLAIANLI